MKRIGVLTAENTHVCHKQYFSTVCDEIAYLNLPLEGGGIRYILGRTISPLFARKIDLSEGDLLLLEGVFEYGGMYKALFKKKITTINFVASPGIIRILGGQYGKIIKRMYLPLINSMDGFIVVSRLYKEELMGRGIEVPIKVAPPFILDKRYKRLLKNKYDASSKVLCTVGYPLEYKGVDFALKVFDKIAEEDEKVRMLVLTREKPEKVLGMVKNKDKVVVASTYDDELFARVISQVGAYIHFGRYEAFGLSVVENMLAGVPAFVSEKTGAKEAVEKVDGSYILPFDVDVSAERILKFLNMEESKKRSISRRSREVARHYSKRNMIRNFKKEFEELISEVKQ